MSRNKTPGRKTARIVRTPATRLPNIQKKLRQAPLRFDRGRRPPPAP